MLETPISATKSEFLSKLSRETESDWQKVCADFLDSVAASQQSDVRRLLESVKCGGSGLRDWVSAIAYRGATLPSHIPEEMVAVYLADSEAVPLHDCEQCGVAIPVRPNRLHGVECEPEQRYFPLCPICDGRTGPYYYWSKQSTPPVSSALRRKKPR